MGRDSKPEEVDRLVKLLGPFADANEQLTRANPVKDQSDAIREATTSDLPALAEADRFVVESGATGFQRGSSVPADIAAIRRALKPEALPPSGGMKAATVSFYREDNLIRKIWVYEGGEWGFERPGGQLDDRREPRTLEDRPEISAEAASLKGDHPRCSRSIHARAFSRCSSVTKAEAEA